jgi:hypothetical protein
MAQDHTPNRTTQPATRAAAHQSSLSSGIARWPAAQPIAEEAPPETASGPERQFPEQAWPVLQRKASGQPVIQRMIRMDMFAADPAFNQIRDIDVLRHFISYGEVGGHFRFVNNRAQSFKQAVNEFIKTQSVDCDTVRGLWGQLQATDNVETAKGLMRDIAGIINAVKSEIPDHPNAFWTGEGAAESGAAAEAPGTIPQTPESRQIANGLWDSLNGGNGQLKREVLHETIGHGDKQKENFMLGVLVFPNRHVMVGVSGQITNLGRLRDFCARYLATNGFTLEGVYDTNNLTDLARQRYRESFEQVTGRQARTFSKEGGDIGNKPGTCAAAVVLGNQDTQRAGNFAERQSAGPGRGKVRLGLTEGFTGKTVTISNRRQPGSEQSWPRAGTNEYDIPSCETCQHQLHRPALDLVKIDRRALLDSYPHRQQALAEKLENDRMELSDKTAIKPAADEKLSVADDELRQIQQKLDLVTKQLDKLSGRKRDKEKELKTIQENNKSTQDTEDTVLTYCKNYLSAQQSADKTFDGMSAYKWWQQFAGLVKLKKGYEHIDTLQRNDYRQYAQKYSDEASQKKAGPQTDKTRSLTQSIQSTQKEIDKIEGDLKGLRATLETKSPDWEKLKNDVVTLEKEIAGLKSSIPHLEAKLPRYEDKIRRETAALEQLNRS